LFFWITLRQKLPEVDEPGEKGAKLTVSILFFASTVVLNSYWMGSAVLLRRDHSKTLDIIAPASWIVLVQVVKDRYFYFKDLRLWLFMIGAIVPMVFPYSYTMWIPILVFALDLCCHFAKYKCLSSISSILAVACIRSLSFYFLMIDCDPVVESFDFALQCAVILGTTIFHVTLGGGHAIPAGIYVLMLSESQINGLEYFLCSGSKFSVWIDEATFGIYLGLIIMHYFWAKTDHKVYQLLKGDVPEMQVDNQSDAESRKGSMAF